MTVLADGKMPVSETVLGAQPIFPEFRRSLPRIVEAIVAALEALIAYAWLIQLISAVYLIAAHFAVVLGYFLAASWVAGGLSGTIVFRSAMLFLVGPLVEVGLVTSLVAGGHEEKAKADRAPAGAGPAADPSATELQSAQADAVLAQIVAGRRSRRDASNRGSLKQGIESGDLDAQQFAIAMISQRYEPEMYPALVSALKSRTPAVRAQAAAVFAKLRERMNSEAKAILRTKSGLLADATAAPRLGDAVLSERCSRLADSGFVDSDTGEELRRLAQILEVGSGPSPDAEPPKTNVGHDLVNAPRVARCPDTVAAWKMPPLTDDACSRLVGGG